MNSEFSTGNAQPMPVHMTAAGWTLCADDWDLFVATLRAMETTDQNHIIDTTLADCRQMLGINAADRARFVSSRPWAKFDLVADGLNAQFR